MIARQSIPKMRDMLISRVLRNPPHREVFIPLRYISNPEDIGAYLRTGDFKGQQADYGITLKDGREIHLRKYSDGYLVHWDMVSPRISWVQHLRVDAPHWYNVVTFLATFGLGLGTAVGYAINSRQSD